MCKNIVNAFNGQLTVNSEIGEGSDFCFTFEVLDFQMTQDSNELNQHNFDFLDINTVVYARKFKKN